MGTILIVRMDFLENKYLSTNTMYWLVFKIMLGIELGLSGNFSVLRI